MKTVTQELLIKTLEFILHQLKNETCEEITLVLNKENKGFGYYNMACNCKFTDMSSVEIQELMEINTTSKFSIITCDKITSVK